MPLLRTKIYVEIDIACAMEQIWHLSQTPELHQRWDLRFTDIHYLPRPDPADPERFVYATRIGFGLEIKGRGESVGSYDGSDGTRSSALRFWSEDPKSLIREGSGYWKYVPNAEGAGSIRFLTLYDYDVRFGFAGRVFDFLIFRPLMGWATAWSFDRLRLWIEKGTDPSLALRVGLCHACARVSVALIWIYQGMVPKLLFKDAGELAMTRALGHTESSAIKIVVAVGIAEVAIGIVLIVAWRYSAMLWFTVIAMPIALLVVAVYSPSILTAAFNPVSLNLSVFAVALVALLLRPHAPAATHCVRRLPRGAK